MAGVATHIPGLIYVVALNAIAADEPARSSAAVQVAIYNALWFARPARRPRARDPAARAGGRVPRARHALGPPARAEPRRSVTFALLGVYLTIKGAVQLF